MPLAIEQMRIGFLQAGYWGILDVVNLKLPEIAFGEMGILIYSRHPSTTLTDDLAHSGVRPSVGSAELKSRHFPSNSVWKYLYFVTQIAQNDIVALQGLMCINVPWVDYIIPIQYRNMVYHMPYSVIFPHGSEQVSNSPKSLHSVHFRVYGHNGIRYIWQLMDLIAITNAFCVL